MTRSAFKTDHARSSHRMPVLVVGGEAYGPGDNVPPAGVKAVARAASATAAAAWVSQLPPDAPAASPAPSKSVRPATILDCFVDPRDDERQRIRDWLAVRRSNG